MTFPDARVGWRTLAGAVVAGSHFVSPRYEPFTERGLPKLTPFLRERFVHELAHPPPD